MNWGFRLRNLPQFSWEGGMKIREEDYGGTWARLYRDDAFYWHGTTENGSWYRIPLERMSRKVPDLEDGITIRILMDKLRILYQEPTLHLAPTLNGWGISRRGGDWLRGDASWEIGESPPLEGEEGEVVVLAFETYHLTNRG